MILLVHMLLGALIGTWIKNISLAILLSIVGHYVLDIIPHAEYSIINLENKRWKEATGDLLKVFSDIIIGLLLIFFFSNNHAIVYICALIAIAPDAVTLLGWILPARLLDLHYRWHEKLHFLKYNKKISLFWRIFLQFAVVLGSIALLQ